MPNSCSFKKMQTLHFGGSLGHQRKYKVVCNCVWLLWKRNSLLILYIWNFWQPRPILRESKLLNFITVLWVIIHHNMWNFGRLEKKDKHHSWKKPIKICCGIMGDFLRSCTGGVWSSSFVGVNTAHTPETGGQLLPLRNDIFLHVISHYFPKNSRCQDCVGHQSGCQHRSWWISLVSKWKMI